MDTLTAGLAWAAVHPCHRPYHRLQHDGNDMALPSQRGDGSRMLTSTLLGQRLATVIVVIVVIALLWVGRGCNVILRIIGIASVAQHGSKLFFRRIRGVKQLLQDIL